VAFRHLKAIETEIRAWLEESCHTLYHVEVVNNTSSSTLKVYIEGDADAVAFVLCWSGADLPEPAPPTAVAPAPIPKKINQSQKQTQKQKQDEYWRKIIKEKIKAVKEEEKKSWDWDDRAAWEDSAQYIRNKVFGYTRTL
jgi:hypothetical protein